MAHSAWLLRYAVCKTRSLTSKWLIQIPQPGALWDLITSYLILSYAPSPSLGPMCCPTTPGEHEDGLADDWGLPIDNYFRWAFETLGIVKPEPATTDNKVNMSEAVATEAPAAPATAVKGMKKNGRAF